MKKHCFAVSLVIHLLFGYLFTTLEFTHRQAPEEIEKKEIIVVTPVKLVTPSFDHAPMEKKQLRIEPEPGPLLTGPTDTPGQPDTGGSKETGPEGTLPGNDGQQRKVIAILEPDPGNSRGRGVDFKPGATAPVAEPRFSLSPGKIRTIIGNNKRRRPGGTPGTALNGSTFKSGRPALSVRGCNIMPWARRTINRIKNNWAIPVMGEMGTKGRVGISVIVEKDGKISSVKLAKSSGSETLDKAASAAFILSNPLPGLPGDYPYHDLRAYFVFNYDDREIEQPPTGRDMK